MTLLKHRLKILLISLVSVSAFLVLSYFYYHQSDQKSESTMISSAERCRCDRGGSDPFEKPAEYSYGSFSGQCIDSCEYRYVDILKMNPAEKQIVISNVYHNEKFWKATIPMGRVEDVEVFFENFRKSFNHVAIRFYFDSEKAVALESQQRRNGRTEKAYTSSLIVSPEGLPPKGGEYNFKDGMLGNHSLIYRFFSIQQYRLFASELNHSLKSYKLKLNKKERNELLAMSIERSAEGLDGVYQLIFNNCATATIDLVLDSKRLLRSPSWDVWDVLDPLRGVPVDYTIGTLSSLEWWGVINLDDSPKIYSPQACPSGLNGYPDHKPLECWH